MQKEIQRAYGYIRVSTSEQSEKGLGLEVQEGQIRKYSEKNKIDLIKVCSDPGHSGADADRPGLQRMLTQAKENKINIILLAHSSRLARDAMLSEIIYRDLRKHNISLISVAQPGYYEQDGDFQRKLMRTILDAFDEYEKSLIAWRLKNGRAKRVELGGWHGGSIYGYDHGDNGQLIVNEREAEIVRYIYYLKKHKRFAAVKIAKTLNNEQIPTKRKRGCWHASTILKVLRNPIYRGKLKYKGAIYEGKHEPIIK